MWQRKVPIICQKPAVQLTWANSMQQGCSWETSSPSGTKEIHHILWNSEVHYHVHQSPAHIPIPRQKKTVHTFPTYLFNIYFNIILSRISSSYKQSYSFRIPQWKPVCICFLPHMCHMLCPSHLPLFNHPNNMKRCTNHEAPHYTLLDLVILSPSWMKSHQPCGLIIPNHQDLSHKVEATALKWMITKVWNPKHTTLLWSSKMSHQKYIHKMVSQQIIMCIPEESRHNDWVLTWKQTVQQHDLSQLQHDQFFQWVGTCLSLAITRFLPSRPAVESAVIQGLHHGLLQCNIFIFDNTPP